MTRKNHEWTDEERVIVRRDYRHTHASRDEIARRLGVSPYGVAGQIANMGLAKSSDRHPWNPPRPRASETWEDERLRDLAHTYCPRKVAQLMHRTLNSVVVRMKRLGIFRRYRDGWYTKKDVCELLGVDHKWVQARINNGSLIASYHDPESPPAKNGSGCWQIREKDLSDFICTYPQDLIGRNIDLIHIVFLLTERSNGNRKKKMVMELNV